MVGVQPLRPNEQTELGGYRLLGRLGEGGMGTVYLAEDADGRRVALKVIRDHLLDRPEFRARFRGEVDRVKNVPPFCTAEVIDADPEHEPPYLVVEYVDGPSLSEIVRESGPLSGAALHSIGLGMATALTAIHNCGVIHRDLKPANVLLPRGGVKVIDFGLARDTAGSTQLTQSDQVMGTIPYIAPERLGNGLTDVTPASDIFAWGAVMVYAATGRTPFAGDSPASTAVRILTDEPNLEGVTGPLRDIVNRTLSKAPQHRPTARELLDELISLGATRAVSTEVLRPAEAAQAMEPSLGLFREGEYDSGPISSPRRRRSLLVAGGVAAVAALSATAVFAASNFLGNPGANAQNNPTATPTVDAPSPSPSDVSPSPSPSGPPRALPSIPAAWYATITGDPLTASSYWAPTHTKTGSCQFGTDGVAATSASSYQCAKVDNVSMRDLIAVVRMKLVTKDACGAIWLRYNGSTGGYVVRVCSDMVYVDELQRDPAKPSNRTLTATTRSFGRIPTTAALQPGQVVDVWISVVQDQLRVSIDGVTRAEFSPLRPVAGQFTFGIDQGKPAKAAKSVVFSDLVLWSPPYRDPPSPSPSVSPSPSAKPSPSVSPSRKPSPVSSV